MRTPVYLIPVYLLVVALSACSPANYLTLKPISGPVVSSGGRSISKATADSVELIGSFERVDFQYLSFDVEVKNNTLTPMEIAPALFRADILDANRQAYQSGTSVGYRTAADPIYEEGRADYRMKKEDKRLKRAKVINTLLFVAIAVSDVAGSQSGRSRDFSGWASNRIRHDAAYDALMAKRLIDHGVFASRLKQYEYEVYRWKELAMKRTVVQPGETVRGLVFVPLVRGASLVNLTYPTPAGNLVELLFEQSTERVRPRQRRRQ